MEQVKRKGIEIKWTLGHAEIRGNKEADGLAKEASKEAESMSDENKCISLAEFKQAAKAHGLSMWQRQWEKGRFLYGLKPKVNKKTVFDFPDRKLYSLIAQLRIGYAKLNEYLHRIGVSETSKCSCREVETIEHYLLHCEIYFNERERMRTVLFQQTGIADLTLDALLGCNDSDLKKEFDLSISSVLGDYITQTARLQ